MTIAVLFLIAVGITILLGAFPWFAIVFGPPLLIFVIFALQQPKGGPAGGAAGQRPKTDRNAVLIGLVVAVIALILTGILLLPYMLPAIWRVKSNIARQQIESVTVAPGVRKIGQFYFPNGLPDDLTFGPEGPTLSDRCILNLNLEPSETTAELNRILQAAHKRYLEMEARYTEKLRSGNSLKVTISPFREEAEKFLEGLWDMVDSILDEEQRALAREHLPLGQLFGKYRFGQARVTIMITKENGTFSHKTKVEWPDRNEESSGTGNTLPAELQRFWNQPEADK